MLRKIRIAAAIVTMIGVTALFLDYTGSLTVWLGWLAKLQLAPAALALNFAVIAGLVAATLIFGRVYCSVICPLGILQDCVNRLRSLFGPKKSRKNRFSYTKAHTALRIAMLAVFVGLLAGGLASIAALIEPYSVYGRIVTQLLAPCYDWINNLLAAGSAADGSYTFVRVDRAFTLPLAAVAAVTLAGVGATAWMAGRLYCNSICPVGTVLGYLSRFSLLKPVINTDKCVNCGLCERRCKGSCIDSKNHSIDYTRCVACMDCIDSCHQKAISYTIAAKRNSNEPEVDETVDEGRRSLAVMAVGIAGAAIASAIDKQGGLAPIVDKRDPERETPLVPAGAKSLRNLTSRCVGCQLCISKCPNRVLKPDMRLEAFMQPRMSYTDGFCRPECTECSHACPDGALQPVSVEQKKRIQIGRAAVDFSLCLSATGKEVCTLCERKCPQGAIMLMETAIDGRQTVAPIVNPAMCIGCGACEYLCPVSPVSAIHVEGYEEHRLA